MVDRFRWWRRRKCSP